MIELVRDLRVINVLTKFENDPWKIMDVRVLTVIFHVRSWKMRKKFAKIFFWRLWKNPELIFITMLSPICVPNLVTLAWKMSSGMPKEAGSLNGPLCAYLMRQNLLDVRDLRVINVLTKFENDPWKIMDVRVLTVIFHVWSWKMRKKFAKIVFWRLWKNPELILITMLSPTCVPNLVTLAWKMSSGMPKEAGSLNGPLCTYLMRQNLHDRTCPRS